MPIFYSKTKNNQIPNIKHYTSISTLVLNEFDEVVHVTAQSTPIEIANPATQLLNGYCVRIRIDDDGTERAITFGDKYIASSDVILPTKTITGSYLVIDVEYDEIEDKIIVINATNKEIPHPVTGSDDNSIATTEWVNADIVAKTRLSTVKIMYAAADGDYNDDGSEYRPKDLVGAIEAMDGSGWVLYIYPGTYDMDVDMPHPNVDVIGIAQGGLVNILGEFSTSHTIGSVRIKNISALDFFITTGYTRFYNCYSKYGLQQAFECDADIVRCDFIGDPNATITVTSPGRLTFYNSMVPLISVNSSAALVSCVDCPAVVMPNTFEGTVIGSNSNFYAFGTGFNALEGLAGLLAFTNCRFLHPDNTLARISISNLCAYSLTNCLYDQANSTIDGVLLANSADFDAIRVRKDLKLVDVQTNTTQTTVLARNETTGVVEEISINDLATNGGISSGTTITDESTVFVSGFFGLDTDSGSSTSPVQTIQQAITLADATGANIAVRPRTYTEDLTVAGYVNMLITTDGTGTSSNSNVTLEGNVTIDALTESFQMKGFNIAPLPINKAINFNALTASTFLFEDLTITQDSSDNALYVTPTDADVQAGIIIFRNCDFNGNNNVTLSEITLPTFTTATATINFEGCKGVKFLSNTVPTGWTVNWYDTEGVIPTTGNVNVLKINQNNLIGYNVSDYDVTKAWKAGIDIVIKDDLFYTPNADVPANVVFVEGTSGQTYRLLGGAGSGGGVTYEFVECQDGSTANIPLSTTPTILGTLNIPSSGKWNITAEAYISVSDGSVGLDILKNGQPFISRTSAVQGIFYASGAYGEYTVINANTKNVTLASGDVLTFRAFEPDAASSYRGDKVPLIFNAQKVSGFLPVEPQPYLGAEYATFYLNAQSSAATGTYIGAGGKWSSYGASPSAGNIVATTDGVTGFTDGVVYVAKFNGDFLSTSGTSYCNWAFDYDGVVNPETIDRTVDRAASGGTQQSGEFRFVGSPNKVLKIKSIFSGTGAAYTTNSYITITAISGQLPLAYDNPLQAQHLHAITNADQNVVTGTKLTAFAVSTSNNITMTNGDVYLTAGTTYELEAAFNSTSNAAINYIVYQFRDNSSNEYLGNKGFFYPMNDTSEASNQHIAKAVYTPSVDTTISVIVTSASATTGIIDASYGYIYVNAIAGQLPANQITEAESVRVDADPATNITSPVAGSVAFDTTDNTLQVYDGSGWLDVGPSAASVTGVAYYSVENTTPISANAAILYPTLIGNSIASYVTVDPTTGAVTLQPNAEGEEAVYSVVFDVGTFSTSSTNPGFVTYGFNTPGGYVGSGGSRFSANYNSTYGAENQDAKHTFFVSGSAQTFTPTIQTAFNAASYSVSVSYNYATQYKGKIFITKIK